jgi:hypothetical protein
MVSPRELIPPTSDPNAAIAHDAAHAPGDAKVTKELARRQLSTVIGWSVTTTCYERGEVPSVKTLQRARRIGAERAFQLPLLMNSYIGQNMGSTCSLVVHRATNAYCVIGNHGRRSNGEQTPGRNAVQHANLDVRGSTISIPLGRCKRIQATCLSLNRA